MPKDSARTRLQLLEAGVRVLQGSGYSGLSTRRVAEEAGAPLSQIHYHFGSKAGLVLAVFEHQNETLLSRQTEMFGGEIALWKQWEMACDYFDDDLASGYVQVLQEMTAAGWSNGEIAGAVRTQLVRWYRLLVDVAAAAAERLDGLGPFTAEELAALVGNAFMGAGELILLGISEEDIASRSALRKIGDLIRTMEESE